MTAQQLLAFLAQQSLVPSDVLMELQRRTTRQRRPVSAVKIVKQLVERGHLSAEQGQLLLAQQEPASVASRLPSPGGADWMKSTGDVVPLDDLTSINQLQPLDELNSPEGTEVIPLDEATLLPVASLGPSGASSPGGHAAPRNSRGWPRAAKPVRASSGRRTSKLSVLAVALGGAALLGLVGAFITITLRMRGDGGPEFEHAKACYEAAQYSQAALEFEAYLTAYPESDRASEAQARMAAAHVLSAKERLVTAPELLAVAEAAVAAAGKADFQAVQSDLAPVLIEMALELVNRARDERSSEAASQRVEEAERAIALVNDGRLVPGTLRPWQTLAAAEETLSLLRWDARRDERTASGLASMERAIAAGNVADALATREDLLHRDWQLHGDPRLSQLERNLTDLVISKVEVSDKGPNAVAGESKSPIQATIGFAARTSEGQLPGQLCFPIANGTVWALDVATGAAVWRRAIGTGRHDVIPTSNVPDADLILVDDARSQLLCVAAENGAVRWHFPLESPAAGTPLVADGRVIFATRDGNVIALDAASGCHLATAKLPTKVRVRLAYDANSNAVAVVADRHFFFLLDAATLKCRNAIFLGHEAGTVVTSPTIASGLAIVVENYQPDAGRLHVALISPAGLKLLDTQPLMVDGHVLTDPAFDGQQMHVVTDRGTVQVFKLTDDRKIPIKPTSKIELGTPERWMHWPAILDGALWIAGDGLRSFRAESSGKFQPQAVFFKEDTLLSPPQLAADSIVTVRRKGTRPDVIVSAVKSNGRLRWEVALALPIVAGPTSGAGGSVSVLTSLGTRADVPVDLQGSHVLATSAVAELAGPLAVLEAIVDLRDGRKVLVPRNSNTELYIADDKLSSVVKLSLPAARSGLVMEWADGILIPTATGSVWLLDVTTGEPKATPLQLPMAPGDTLNKCALAAASAHSADFAISDGKSSLYTVGLNLRPQPHLAIQSHTVLPRLLSGTIASVEGTLYAGVDAGRIHVFSTPDLALRGTWEGPGSDVSVGPLRCGPVVLVFTASGEVACFDGSVQPRWEHVLDIGSLAGAPVVDGSTILLASCRGELIRLSLKSGKEQGRIEVSSPLAGTPLPIGEALLVPTADGSLLRAMIPEPGVASP